MMFVHVSSLSGYEFCPRTIYLKYVLGFKPEKTIKHSKSLIEHAVRKELSLRQPKIIVKIREPTELHNILEGEINAIIDEIPLIYKRELEGIDYAGYLDSIRSEMLAEINLVEEKLSSMFEDMGFEGALNRLTPWKIDYTVKSDKLGLSGRIDKVMRSDFLFPVGVKTGRAPEGVWAGDRLQACAYGMLLEEKFRGFVPYSVVEYARIQDERHVFLTEGLRRRVFFVRDSILNVLEGVVPEICSHGSGRKCGSCGFNRKCYEI